MKDNFSDQSQNYANFRPKYPNAVFNEIMKHVAERSKAWDCATGNGQVAEELSKLFNQVEATDISENQIEQAPKLKNINYSIQPAENVDFKDHSFDLITVAQAIHWFDFDKFYDEVKRTLKPEGILAVLGYSLFKTNAETNKIMQHFYYEVIGPYWDEERKYLDEGYDTIPFPFKEIATSKINFKEEWSFDRLIGYLKTWSAVKHFIAKNGYDPVDDIYKDLKMSFGTSNTIEFPILFKIGKLL
ncbi:class I SAM-dependent methyltransferase [Zunongwangia endophytica]|uniref:Class I SAM-dependent methyltransferase n=1 Tax=Zunongwangia endophytica TaxID=1808945 RepID=A0ABV8HFE8_9FLAO|nr:class I SAM-dependent methyltransferase [Zunongwangia endophytica]MDN3594013.1 class I SAM-dependent methyltransferase [Zunongwangia endophytica]